MSNAPLLGHAQEDQLWDRVEAAPASDVETTTVSELLKEHASTFLKFLQTRGVKKIGEFRVPDKLVMGKLGDDSIMTMGADQASINCEAAWRRELGGPAKVQAGWETTIPVVAYVVTVRSAANADKDGLLQPLLKRWQAGGLSYSAFALPPVQAVIDWKWNRFCKTLLLWELAFFLLWLFSFFAFTILFQDEDTHLSLREMLVTPRGRATVACDVLSLLGMTPFLIIEASTIVAYGWGWATAWNLLDATTYVVQIAVVVMHLGRLNINSDYLSLLASTQCILLLFRLQYFSRVFRATRFAFLDSLKEVLHDVKWYLVFLLLIIVGFASSFHVMYRRDQKKHENFSTIGKSFVTMVDWAAGNSDLSSLYKDAHNPVGGSLLGILFVFVLATVLVNLLISIMTNTLDKVTRNQGLRMLLSKAQAIDELETTIPPYVDRFFPDLYPPFLHVLRVDPGKLDQVKLDQLWTTTGAEDEQDELLEAQQGSDKGEDKEPKKVSASGSKAGRRAGGNTNLEAKMDAIQADIAAIKELLQMQPEKQAVVRAEQ